MERVDLAYAGITRQVELLRARELSARELLEVYLDRIEQLDPQLNSFRTVMSACRSRSRTPSTSRAS